MNKDNILINEKLILSNQEFKNKNDCIEQIANLLKKENLIKDENKIVEGLIEREKEVSTGIGEGIAIPHCVVEELETPQVVIFRLNKDLDWDSIDNKPVNLVISILVPASKRDEHFWILTKLSTSLVDKNNIEKFRKLQSSELANFINQNILKEEESTKDNNENDSSVEEKTKKLKVVGVTTCPTGVAHTFMAAKALEDEGNSRGWDIHIEKQGQVTKDALKQYEINQADYVIFAVGKGIEEVERFDGKKIYQTSVSEPITNAKKSLDDMLKFAKKDTDSKGSTVVQAVDGRRKKSFNEGAIRHLLSGISYMIPFIAFAGILLGITTAFGFSTGWISDSTGLIDSSQGNDPSVTIPGFTYGFGPKTTFALAWSNLAGFGFTLFIPILGGYIAYSIAGRKALAPAMIISIMLNDSTGTSLFNYQEGQFGNFSDPVALGFFGSIAAGYLIGYGIVWMTKHTDKIDNNAFQTIMPLLIIPLVFGIVPWAFFAFFGYLPLYWLGIGLNSLITNLIDVNLLWLVGLIMGMMICFDLGGPVNKMAMVTAVAFLEVGSSSYFPLLNGVCAVCVSIPPMVLVATAYVAPAFNVRMSEEEKVNATSAGVMGFFGITEGSIPFAAAKPKTFIPSFMFAGAIAGSLAIVAGVGNSVALWGGPIIYLAGGMGQSPDIGGTAMQTDYAFALLYFIPLIIGTFAGMFAVVFLTKVYDRQENRLSYEYLKTLKENYKKDKKAFLLERKNLSKDLKESKLTKDVYDQKILSSKEKLNKQKEIFIENKEKLKSYDASYFKKVKEILPNEKENFRKEKIQFNNELKELKENLKKQKEVRKEEIKKLKDSINRSTEDNETLIELKRQLKELKENKFSNLKKEIKDLKIKKNNAHMLFINKKFADSIKKEYDDELSKFVEIKV